MTQDVDPNALALALRDIHLPAEAAGGWLAEVAATMTLAGLAAIVVVMLARMLSQRAPRKSKPNLREQVAALDALPENDARIAALHLLKAHKPERFADLRNRLYDGRQRLSLSRIKQDLLSND